MKRAAHHALVISLIVALASGCSRQGSREASPRVPRKVIDLSTTITSDLPVRLWGHKALSDFGFSDTTEFRVIQRDKPLYVSNSYWTLFNHGGTHADAPNHFDRDARGIDATPLESLVGPIRVMDVRSHALDKPIDLSEVKTMGVLPGEIAILFGAYKPPSRPDEIPSFQYLSKEAADYLAALPVKAFGTDGLSVDSFQRIYDLMAQKAEGYQTLAPVHAAFLPRGIPVVEALVNVEALLGENSAVFVGFPLKVRDGDGSPIRAAALVY